MSRVAIMAVACSVVLGTSGFAQAQTASLGSPVVSYDRVAIGFLSAAVPVNGSGGQKVYVGMTVRRADGREFDFPAQEISLSGTSQVQFSATIGMDYAEYVISVWTRKVTPCDSSRPGCAKYGYVLDGQLATTGWNTIP